MRPTRLQSVVRRSLRDLGLGHPGETIVSGLSGGADSVALLDALQAIATRDGFRLVAAHLDHGLREGSAADAAFCQALCDRLGVPLRTALKDVRARAAAERGGLEQAARGERHNFLRQVMTDEDAVAVALAHTRDDQAETVLLRLLRGSGSLGLGAMRARSGAFVRPMLAVGRQEVVDHLQARGLDWREDPTNQDLAIMRNRVRHELLPYLESRFNPAVREALARAAAVLADEADALGAIAGDAAHVYGDVVTLPRSALAHVRDALARVRVRRALSRAGGLRGVTLDQVDSVLALARRADGSGRSVVLPGGREATVNFDEVRIGPRTAPVSPFALALPVPGGVTLPDGSRLETEPAQPSERGRRDVVVIAVPEGPLQVRTRYPGDRVNVRGGDKSLRRYLMDRRVPAAERDRLAVIAAGGRILWIEGQPVPAPAGGDSYVRLRLVPPAGKAIA